MKKSQLQYQPASHCQQPMRSVKSMKACWWLQKETLSSMTCTTSVASETQLSVPSGLVQMATCGKKVTSPHQEQQNLMPPYWTTSFAQSPWMTDNRYAHRRVA